MSSIGDSLVTALLFARGSAGPQGPAGPTGPEGKRYPTGVISTDPAVVFSSPISGMGDTPYSEILRRLMTYHFNSILIDATFGNPILMPTTGGVTVSGTDLYLGIPGLEGISASIPVSQLDGFSTILEVSGDGTAGTITFQNVWKSVADAITGSTAAFTLDRSDTVVKAWEFVLVSAELNFWIVREAYPAT